MNTYLRASAYFLFIFSIGQLFPASDLPLHFASKLGAEITRRVGVFCNSAILGDHTLQLSGARDGFSQNFITSVVDATSAVHNRTYTANGKVIQTESSDVCFRGQRMAERSLVSALGRQKMVDKVTYLLANHIPHDETLDRMDPVSQLSYLQHYGVHTPLLDWTKSPEVALYYALRNYRGQGSFGEKTAALFILDLYGLNELYRLTKFYGTMVGGLALPEDFDAIVRARHVVNHSHFGLARDTFVSRAAKKEGLTVSSEEDALKVCCERNGTRIDPGVIKLRLEGPVAVFPKWTKRNQRVRELQSIFTIDGIFNSIQHDHYMRHTLKIALDHTCVEALLKHEPLTKRWEKIDKLENSPADKSFNELARSFQSMMGRY
jgi:hypothetical protein